MIIKCSGDLVEKIKSPVLLDSNRSFKWQNTLSLTKASFAVTFTVHHSHGASRLLGLCFLVLKNVIFRLCLLHEDGIAEAYISGSI